MKRPWGWSLPILILISGLLLIRHLSAAEKNPTLPADWPRTFRLGYVAVSGGANRSDPSQVVGQYLARELKLEVKVVSYPDYLSLIGGFKARNLEGAYLGPYPYVEAAELAEVEAAVMELDPQGRRGYRSILITRTGSGIHRLEDGRGRVLAFTYPDSTSGCLIPMLHFLRDLGQPPGTFASKVVFAGTHQAVVQGVFNHSYALGATNDLDFARAVEELHLQVQEFQVLWTSPMIPGSVYAIRKDLPESFKKTLRQSLLNLKDPSLLASMKIGGFGPADNSEYTIIRQLRELRR